MTGKRTATYGLLVVAMAIAAYLFVATKSASDEAPESAVETRVDTSVISSGVAVDTSSESKYVAFYFHGSRRCVTCRTIEANAETALKERFADEFSSGVFSWRPVNAELPENQHYIREFQLANSTVVIAEMNGATPVRWKQLNDVWRLVRNRAAFDAYVQNETVAFMGDGS